MRASQGACHSWTSRVTKSLSLCPGREHVCRRRSLCQGLYSPSLPDSPHPPHKCEGPSRVMKPSLENLPGGQPASFQPDVHWASTTALDTRGSPRLHRGGSGFWHVLRAPGLPLSPLCLLLSRGRGEGSTDSHTPVRLPCPPHHHLSPLHRGTKTDLSPCPKSSNDLSKYRSSIFQYALCTHTHYIV